MEDRYLEVLTRFKRYVDELSFRAVCARFRSWIIIFIDTVSPSAQTVVYGQKRGSCAALLLFRKSHYQLALPKKGETVPAWVHELRDSPDLDSFPRGGGKGSPVRSWCTLRSSSPRRARAAACHGVGKPSTYCTYCTAARGRQRLQLDCQACQDGGYDPRVLFRFQQAGRQVLTVPFKQVRMTRRPLELISCPNREG